eukprot:m.194601 g.194601  ORF g.194601 m.194601 type:complete len:521 (-) comp15676_c0_seq6:2947-4509(-)
MTIAAVVYLSGGDECRCLLIGGESTVQNLVDGMLKVQQDWEDVTGNSSESKDAEHSSSAFTDDPQDQFGIVLVQKDKAGIIAERVLPKSMSLASPELTPLRQSWSRTMLRHMQRRFANTAKVAGKEVKDTNTSKSTNEKRPKKAMQSKEREYWFISPSAKREDSNPVRVKFVNLDEYEIVKGKEGWLDVKDKGGRKQRWVVVQENNLYCYNEPDDEEPLFTIENISTCKLETKMKPAKNKFSITLVQRKTKITLNFDNDVMLSRWQEALQTKSNTDKTPQSKGPVLKLKSGLEVEEIPEYTEEEEMRDIQTSRPKETDLYLTIDSLKSIAKEDGGYITAEALRKAAIQDSYLTVDSMNNLYINNNGNYLTVEAVSSLLFRTGHLQEDGYMSVEAAHSLVNLMRKKSDHITPAACVEAAKEVPGYLSVEAMSQLVTTEQALGGQYLTVEEAANLVCRAVRDDAGDYMTLESLHSGDYLTIEDVQQHLKHQRDKQGEYLSFEDMQHLFQDAGYMSLSELNNV